MSSPNSSKPHNALALFLGTLAAFASFAVIAALLQAVAGGKPEDPASAERTQKKDDVAKEQAALLEKYGISGDGSAVFAKSLEQIKTRKIAATTVVVPGSPTALKAAAAPAPAAPAPAAGTPAPTTPVPATPAPATPVPAPAAPAPSPPPAAPTPPAAAPTTPAPAPK